MKKVLLIFVLFLLLNCSQAFAFYNTLDIHFNEEIYLIEEEFKNTPKELLLTVLYTSDPDTARDSSAEICEFEASEIEDPLLPFRLAPFPVNAEGENVVPERKENVATDSCAAVRIHYRYSPSPVPDDAKIVFAQLHFGNPSIELILAQTSAHADPSAAKIARRFTQNENDIQIRSTFFGDEGGRIYHESSATGEELDTYSGTRHMTHFNIDEFENGYGYVKFRLLSEEEYVHREMSPYGVSRLYNGEWTSGGGGGGYALTDIETFDEPNVKSAAELFYTHRYLENNLNLYQMSWYFSKYPEIRIAFTLDGRNILSWNTVFDTFVKFTVDFPGIEQLEFKDEQYPDVPFLNLKN